MLGPGKTFDTSKYLVVCANVLGSCYGTTGPGSVDPASGKVYGNTFPRVSLYNKSIKYVYICVS